MGARGFGCSSCLTAPDGINLAPDTLLLVWTDATITQLSVDVGFSALLGGLTDVGVFCLWVVEVTGLLETLVAVTVEKLGDGVVEVDRKSVV